MAFAESDTVPSRFGLHSRIALALSHATVDCQIQQRLDPFGSFAQVAADPHDYVQDLLKECAPAWNQLTNHPFPLAMAKGTAPLNGFRHYMIQDASYLEYYYRVRMEAIGKSGTFEEIQEFAAKLSSSLGYVAGARDDCTNKLGVPKDDVAKEPKSQQLQNSINLYEGVVKNGDWLDIHIVLLPCILGYDTIASNLLSDSETIRNTLYFPLWIQANAGGSSAAKYKKFINSSIDSLSPDDRKKRWPSWVENFNKACGTEGAFFGLASPNVFPAYNIVSNGTYKIRSYRKGNPYLTSVKAPSVTVQTSDPHDNGTWKLTNGPNGYTIENVKEKSFLRVAVGPGIKPSYDATVSNLLPQYQWSINPVKITGAKEQYAYQFLVPEKLQFVLDAGSDVSDPKVVVANNSQIASQLWLLEKVA